VYTYTNLYKSATTKILQEMITPTTKKYNVQEVADSLGIYRGTVINYEKRGIFPPPKRNPINGYREYTEEEVDRLRGIVNGSETAEQN